MLMSTVLASILALLFYILSILVHIFVIRRIIPFNWVNGGRSESYENQVQLSLKSIPVLVGGMIFILIGVLAPSVIDSLIYSALASIFTLFWLLGVIMQILGSKFEKFVMSFVLLLGVVSHLQLALIFMIG